jgi:hypothetical protein
MPMVSARRTVVLRRPSGVVQMFNPNNKNGHIVLTNGNLTATSDGATAAYATVLSTKSAFGSQKVYWEVHIDNISNSFSGIGIGNGSVSVADGQALSSTNNGLFYVVNGGIYVNGHQTDIAGYGSTSRIGCALDLLNNKIWFTLNGTIWNNDTIANQNPATNTGGLNLATMTLNAGPYFAGASFLSASEGVTANFGATAFTYAIPSGFVAFQ